VTQRATAHQAALRAREYRRNHYVPEWYQRRFIAPDAREQKYFFLDLKPDSFLDATGRRRTRTGLRRWGPDRCFQQTDLYTTRFGGWESTEIERRFFGEIDDAGRRAVDYFTNFKHPSVDDEAFHSLMVFMSTQKLRTPKGLAYLGSLTQTFDHNSVLFELQRLQHLHAAIWTESIWAIADASRSNIKFIISDHPVTVYNLACFPGATECAGFRDPYIWQTGTHTFFPLSFDKVLILTNLSWVRDPYTRATKHRPNNVLIRPTMFDIRSIQVGRYLSEIEVSEINFVTKKRAFRFIAAGKEEWLYPERAIPSQHWNKLGGGYLFMPDPRGVLFGGEILIGYGGGRSDAFDEYGLKPWQHGYADKARSEHEWETYLRFQGEFARLFGPVRRGRSFQMDRLDPEVDDAEYHEYHLELERRRNPKASSRAKRR
jgi:hypothetical protein